MDDDRNLSVTEAAQHLGVPGASFTRCSLTGASEPSSSARAPSSPAARSGGSWQMSSLVKEIMLPPNSGRSVENFSQKHEQPYDEPREVKMLHKASQVETTFVKPLLDIRRVKFLLFEYEPPLHDPAAVKRFVGSVYTASGGNPQALRALVMALREWQDFYNVHVVADLELLWRSFEFEQPVPNAISFLKACCSLKTPMSPVMERAIFDQSSDFSHLYRDFCEYYSQFYDDPLFTCDDSGEHS
jgi:hypothetical protein